MKLWEQLPHRVYYATEEEQLYTDYQVWVHFDTYKDDEALEDYNGDFLAWVADGERFDVLRPCEACTVLWFEHDGVHYPLLIDAYMTEDIANTECESWGWFYDDGFTHGSLPMSVVNFDTCTEDARDWLADPANAYTAPYWEGLLYCGIPEDVTNA